MSRASDSLASLSGFVETYFTDEAGAPLRLSRGQRHACDTIDQGWFGEGYAGCAVEMPRGHGKSMLMKAAVIRAILLGKRYVVILASGDLSEQFSNDIANIISGSGAPLIMGGDNRPLLLTDHDLRPATDYPDRRNRPRQLWRIRDRLIYVGGWEMQHTARLSVRGMTGGRGSVRGLVNGAQRPDLLIVDDPMKEVEADNERITEAVKWFVKGSYLPCGGPASRFGLFGTPFNDADLITEAAGNAETPPVLSAWPNVARCVLPAIHPRSGAVLAPHFPRRALDARLEAVGSIAFLREYLLRPRGVGARTFLEAWITAHTGRPPAAPPGQPRPFLRGMFLDPSLGRNKNRGDYSAIVIVDKERSTGREWVRRASIARRRSQVIVADYLDLWALFRPDVHAVEDAGAQELLIPIFQEEIARRGIPAEACPRLQSTEGVPKVLRIKRLSPVIEFGGMWWDEEGDHRDLRKQLTSWGGTENETDDGPDALEGCHRLLSSSHGIDAIRARMGALRGSR